MWEDSHIKRAVKEYSYKKRLDVSMLHKECGLTVRRVLRVSLIERMRQEATN